MAHQSDSAAQREARALIRDKLAQALGVGLDSRFVKLGEGATVQVDGCAADESVFVEIFAHRGPLEDAQKQRVKGDALKLISLAKGRPSARLILAFGGEEAARYALEESWVADAIRPWGIEVFVVELGAGARRPASRAGQAAHGQPGSFWPAKAEKQRFDQLLAKALPVAGERLAAHRGAPSFLERCLEDALVEAIASVDVSSKAKRTGRKLVSIPNWDKRLGGFDLRVGSKSGSGGEALAELKVDDVEHTLWDLFKLAAGLTMPGVDAAYMILARPAHPLRECDCSVLFEDRQVPTRWVSAAMFKEWRRAWTDLTGPKGGSARPLSVPSKIETEFIGAAPAKGFDGYEIRCVAVRLVPGAEDLRFEGSWPVSPTGG